MSATVTTTKCSNPITLKGLQESIKELEAITKLNARKAATKARQGKTWR